MSKLAGALLSGGLGLLKGVLGGIQASRGNKQLNKLLGNRPQYSIPEAYMKALQTAQGLAAQDLPGQNYYEQQIGQSSARAMNAAEKGAISSNVYQGAVESSQTKELDALRDLANMGVQWKTQQKQNLMAAQNTMGGLQQEAWDYNVNQPYQVKLNMAAENRQAGMSNMFSGLQDTASSAINFVGTSYYQKILEELQKNNKTK